jgi:hypothetical protein
VTIRGKGKEGVFSDDLSRNEFDRDMYVPKHIHGGDQVEILDIQVHVPVPICGKGAVPKAFGGGEVRCPSGNIPRVVDEVSPHSDMDTMDDRPVRADVYHKSSKGDCFALGAPVLVMKCMVSDPAMYPPTPWARHPQSLEADRSIAGNKKNKNNWPVITAHCRFAPHAFMASV